MHQFLLDNRVDLIERCKAKVANLGVLVHELRNILQTATLALNAHADGTRILVEVADHCGGLPHGAAETMFRPFTQTGEDRSGLALSIARRAVEADGGTLSVRDMPGTGCAFTIDMPQRALH